VVALQPNPPEAHLNLGIALADGFDLESALAEFSQVVNLAPTSSAARYNKGRALFDLRRYEDARAELEAAARQSPDLSPALYLLALAEKQLDHVARSTEVLKRVVALEPRNADALYQLGQDLSRAGQTKEAVVYWKKAVEINPDHAEALYNLTRATVSTNPTEAKQYQERFAALQKKRQITDRAETLGNFALASAGARDWPQAVAQLKEALDICGECRSKADLHKNLGLIYCKSGALREGARELRLALQLKPQDHDVLQALNVIATLLPGQ
jgi:tetratricopeptide (TPR) repeat protein